MATTATRLLGLSASVFVLAFAGAAEALTTITIDKCLDGKLKAEAKGAASHGGCYAKAAKKFLPTDPECLDKAESKMVEAFGRRDDKGGCAIQGDGSARSGDVASYAASVDAAVGHAGSCDGTKSKHVGKYVAARLSCYAKAARKTGTVDASCLTKAAAQLADRIGKAEDKPPCTNLGQAPALSADADVFADAQACALGAGDPMCPPVPTTTPTPTPTRSPTPTPTITVTATPGVCGDGFNAPDERCDETAPSAGWAGCHPDFTCVACNCACPTTMTLSVDASDPTTLLDRGWTGIAHRNHVTSSIDLTFAVSCGPSARPCGVCSVGAALGNAGSTMLRNQRCTGDTSVSCTSAPGGIVGCGGPLGTCELYVGAPLPLYSGGVRSCVLTRIGGPVTGTVDVESGQASLATTVSSVVHGGPFSLDPPCPACVGDATSNDGIQGGTCSGGARSGLACDANATVPGRPDFAATSLDCPSSDPIIAVSATDLSASTGTSSLAITAASPNCSGAGLPLGSKCACDTCNNANAEPCTTNADCPISGGNPGICGGRRCFGGSNAGGPCVGASGCPGGTCGRPGEPTKVNGCQDNHFTVFDGTFCVDTAPVGDHEGECPEGPETGRCSPSSGHEQRNCTTSNECCDDPPFCTLDPPTPGDCILTNRLCFLDNGLGGSIVAAGMADAPLGDSSEPTLAAVFCEGPTTSASQNIAVGIPGPARLTLKGTMTVRP